MLKDTVCLHLNQCLVFNGRSYLQHCTIMFQKITQQNRLKLWDNRKTKYVSFYAQIFFSSKQRDREDGISLLSPAKYKMSVWEKVMNC